MRTIMRETVMDTEGVDPHLTATIVGSYVRHHTVGADQVSDLMPQYTGRLVSLDNQLSPEKF